MNNHTEQEPDMQEIKSILHRSSATIWQDLAGAVSLVVVLMAGLHLPGLF